MTHGETYYYRQKNDVEHLFTIEDFITCLLIFTFTNSAAATLTMKIEDQENYFYIKKEKRAGVVDSPISLQFKIENEIFKSMYL